MPNAKGTTLLRAVRFLRRHRERARELLKPELHHYLEERIRESKWYPEEDLLALLEAILPLIPGEPAVVLAGMGAQTAREHMQGIYAHLSSGQNTAPSPSKVFALWSSQHDSGRFEVNRIGPAETVMTVRDFSHPSEIMCGIFTGYIEEIWRFAGDQSVRTTKRECVLRGDPLCSWHVAHAVDAGSVPDEFEK